MGEEVPLAAELHDRGVGGVAVARDLGYDAFVLVWAVGTVRHGVGDLLGPASGKGEVVFTVVFVYPRSLREVELLVVDTLYRAVDLGHVAFQACAVAHLVAPEYPCLPVVVDEDRRVDAYPRVCGVEAILICQQGAPYGVAVGPLGAVGHGHAYARAVGTDEVVVFAVAFDHMRRISRTRSVPREVGHTQRRGVLRPVDHVGGREDTPVLEFVSVLVALVVMPREQPQRVARDHRRRVGRMLVADDGVARGLEFVFSPSLAQGIHLLACQGYDAAVARMEILVEGAGDRVETVEVVACLVLVAARGVEVVHQYVTLFAVELEYARPLDGCLARIGVQIDEILLPRAAQRRGGGLLYAVLYLAALVVLGVALVE